MAIVTQASKSRSLAIVIGATGLVGRLLIQQLLQSGYYQTVYAVVRKPFDLSSYDSVDAQTQLAWIQIPDFNQLHQVLSNYDLSGADAFSALGSTQKQAGSKTAFYQIDHDFSLAFAQVCYQQGARHLLLVSAMGANAHSLVFYNRVKGILEADIQKIGFEHFSVFRPSLLLGARAHEKRWAEDIGQNLFTWGQKLLPETFSARPIEANRVALAMSQVARLKANDNALKPLAHDICIYSNHEMLKATLNTT
ncbi:NAD(P)H-binding protein [Aquirhabdus sp.]|uniref:NAD(P)H-binding protein n=1 Tax=Aquirhabdus sp. TaxID=2824160 RepID=UPI00396CEE8C